MNKVLVVVMTADRMPYLHRVAVCKETWLRYIPNWASSWVLSGPKLGVPDGYGMMSYKTRALCKRALMTPGWEWMLRVDDDVCLDWRSVIIPNSGVDYCGPSVPLKPNDKIPYSAGAVMWLSRRAVEILATKMQVGMGVVEDKEIGRVLFEAGISVKPMNVHYVVGRPDRSGEISNWDAQQMCRTGFALEVGSPENMKKIHNLLGLSESLDPSIIYEAKLQTGSRRESNISTILVGVNRPEIPVPAGSAVYRDWQGREVARGSTVYNKPGQDAPRGPAIARPQEDPAWHDTGQPRVRKS